MKRKPWPLIILALLHVLAPFGNLFLNSVRHDVSMIQLWGLWWAYLPQFAVSTYLVVPIFAGYFIFVCKRWSFYAYLACLSWILIVSLYGFTTDMNVSSFIYLILTLVIDLLLVVYVMVPAVKQVYLDPRLRWWESAPRFHANIEAEISNAGIGKIVNISEGGMFFKSNFLLEDNAHVEIKFSYNNLNYLVSGEVVHHRMMEEHGYGIQFTHDVISAKALKKLVQNMNEDGRMLNDRLPGDEDSFIAWLRGLVVSGKGFLPTSGKR